MHTGTVLDFKVISISDIFQDTLNKEITLNNNHYKHCTFKLRNVNMAPNKPPMTPRITVGINARRFKPIP